MKKINSSPLSISVLLFASLTGLDKERERERGGGEGGWVCVRVCVCVCDVMYISVWFFTVSTPIIFQAEEQLASKTRKCCTAYYTN